MKAVRIAIVGDFHPEWSHHPTIEQSLLHAAASTSNTVEVKWVGTDAIASSGTKLLEDFNGIWCASGSPYKSTDGALSSITFAREKGRAFFAT